MTTDEAIGYWINHECVDDKEQSEAVQVAIAALHRAAEDDKAREEGCAGVQFAIGGTVWVVERDENSEPCEVSGYVFLTEVAGYAFVSPTINGSSDVEDIFADAVESTARDYHADFGVYPIADCHKTRQAAEAALEGGGQDD